MNKTIIASLLISAVAIAAVPAVADQQGKGPRGEEHRMDRQSFADLDADGSGTITLEEIQAPKSERFAEIDTNGDGFITTDEMMMHMAAKMIERQDENGDGKLSPDELGGPNLERMFRFLDENGDGEVTEEEWDSAKEMGRHFRGRGEGRGRH